MHSLAGRTVMVSGANRGIGAAIARRLHDDGARLSLGARRPETLDDVVAGMDADRVLVHAYDATEAGSDEAWLAATVERYGGLDALVNNAGLFEHLTLDDGDDEALDRMFAVNVKGPYRLTRLALPALRAADHGRVVNLSSLSGVRIANDEVGYSMSKFAMTALSHATRRFGWDDGVRVTNVCPGFVATDMAMAVGGQMDPAAVIQTEDLAELVSTVLRLPDTASVAELTVACRYEATV
ncbi:MAG: SDR family NAD(P)-dependent oxidoreductase [Actinomycetota bacterium]